VDYTLLAMLNQGRWASWERQICVFARSLKVPPILVLANHMARVMSAYGSDCELEDLVPWAVDLADDVSLPSFRDAVENIRRTVEQSPWFLENGRIQ
jgi:hypothetical protein